MAERRWVVGWIGRVVKAEWVGGWVVGFVCVCLCVCVCGCDGLVGAAFWGWVGCSVKN